MADYVSKTGSVTYTVITDTHCYPWGTRTADIDLGDNTNADSNYFCEPVEVNNISKISIYGNHDVAQLAYEGKATRKGLQAYADSTHKVLLLGLDSAKSFSQYEIDSNDIVAVAEALQGLAEDWDVVILTHVPLFPACSDDNGCWGPNEEAKWDDEKISMKSANDLLIILAAFQVSGKAIYKEVTYDYSTKTTNNVIGCFCGHIHNSVKCVVKPTPSMGEFAWEEVIDTPIYMEAFFTNGASEYTPLNATNAGLYAPPQCGIAIDFDAKTVNGTTYLNPNFAIQVNQQNHGHAKGDAASGTMKMRDSGSAYPKFLADGRYLGWSESPSGGAVENNVQTWPTEPRTVLQYGSSKVMASEIKFDAHGFLRFYHENGQRIQIPSYTASKVLFQSNQATNALWKFVNGRFEDVVSVNCSYRSGTIVGKNGYSLTFNSSGLISGVTLNGVLQSYAAGDNWINVVSIRFYDDFFCAPNTYTVVETTPQIGITGTIDSGAALNMVRSTSAGTNLVGNKAYTLVRVVDMNNQVYWLYQGKLTTLTDDYFGIGSGGTLDPNVAYTSGEIVGKNGYSITFDSNGYAKAITLNGVAQSYTAGNNWINISTVQVYPDFENDPDNSQYTNYAAQVGITGTFGSATRINLARSGANGENWITGRYLWVRVMDENGVAHWLYDGRMTPHTDASRLGISPTYTSGEIVGKNGYNITFKSNGYAKAITHNGVIQSYTAGNNWINVSTVRVYPDYESDPTDYRYTNYAAQIGITGTFGSVTRINVARSGANGSNWLGSTRYLLTRVMDENGTAYWLYDGRLTDYTDEDLEKSTL